MRAKLVVALLAGALGLGGACQTVDLGAPPADINACRPSEAFFASDVWPNVLNKSYGGKKCSDATCHDPASGKPLTLDANPQPPTNPPVPLTDVWAKNYRSATEQMSCADVTASSLIIYPTATRPHGGGKLFDITSPDALTIEQWVMAP